MPPFPPPPIQRTVSPKTLACIEFGAYAGLGAMGKGLLKAHTAPFFDPKMLDIIRDMREAILFRETHVRNGSGPILEELEYFQVKSRWLDYRLLSFPFERPHQTDSEVQEACRISFCSSLSTRILTCTSLPRHCSGLWPSS